jgi:hypothetical protein
MAFTWLQSKAVTLYSLATVPFYLIYLVGHRLCMMITVVLLYYDTMIFNLVYT